MQTICLEEDAAKLISDNGMIREYGLDRLGVPLVEIALEPVTGKPQEIMQVALTLGRLLRASKRVARGLGSIRQDVNISVDNGNVVEVKGVQQLDQLISVIEYEMRRQHGLILIAQKLKKEKHLVDGIGDRIEDVTNILGRSTLNIVKKSLADWDAKAVFKAIRVRGFSGIIGYEPYPDIRIGKQLSELVRFYGLGGVFHSDELPNYGITGEEVDAIKKKLELVADIDAFVIVGGPNDKVEFAVDAIIQRLKMALDGVPPKLVQQLLMVKLSLADQDLELPRMYPETDIQSIPISNTTMLDSLSHRIPEPWDEMINTLAKKHGMNKKLAEQIFDSPYLKLFEDIVRSTTIQPAFIASKLTEDLINLQRQGLDMTPLNENIILDTFKRLDAGNTAKESVVLIFEKIMKKESKTVDEAIAALGIKPIKEQELQGTIDHILEQNMSIIRSKGIASLGMLMGRCMSVLRGRADGEKINSILKQKLEQLLSSNTDLKKT